MVEEQIKNYFNRYVDFKEEEVEEFCRCLLPQTFKKKEFLLKEGEVCRSNFFITRGLTRSFYVDEKGNEKILQFGIENWWVTIIESFIKERPANVNIQAIEETSVLSISKAELEAPYVSIPSLERLFRIITQNMLIAIQRRYEFYQKKSSIERYEMLVKSLPHFVLRVPQYMLASYLEITPEYLSELRKKK